VRGLKIRRQTEGGTVSWVLQFSLRGRVSKKTLGIYPAMKLADARAEAYRVKALVAEGRDPVAEARRPSTEPTVSDLLDAYLERHIPKLAPRTQKDQRAMVGRIRRRFGRLLARDLKRRAVADWHAKMKETPTSANRQLEVLASVYTQADAWGLVEGLPNPARLPRGVRYAEKPRVWRPSDGELAALAEAIEEEREQAPLAAAAIELCLWTGMRRGEALSLAWEDWDKDRHMVHLRDTKTGDSGRPLLPHAEQVLWRLQALTGASEWVFPSKRRRGEHLREMPVRRCWDRIRGRAKLPTLQLRDLRKVIATEVAEVGGLELAAATVGHAGIATTLRHYARFRDEAKRAALDAAGESLARKMKG
jgi:integrase